MRRVVVTGLGAVTPLAASVEAFWSRLLAGRSDTTADARHVASGLEDGKRARRAIANGFGFGGVSAGALFRR